MSTTTLEALLAQRLVTCAMSQCPHARSPVRSPKVDAKSPPSLLREGVPGSCSPEGRNTTQMRRRPRGDSVRRLCAIHIGDPRFRLGAATRSEADRHALLDLGRNALAGERGPAPKCSDLLSLTLAQSDEG